MAKSLITIDLKTEPQMSEAFKKLTPSLEKATAQLKKFGSLSSGMKAGTQSFTESLNAMKASIEQLKSGPLTLKEIEESEFMMALKNVSLHNLAPVMQSQEALKKLAAIVYCAGGSIDIPMSQIEEAHFIGGGKYGSAHCLLLTPKVQSYMGNGYEVWQGYPFDLEVMPNHMSQCLTVYSKSKELSFAGMDFANGSDTTTISILQPEMKYLEHYDYSMPQGITQKMVVGVEKGPALVSSETHGMGQVDKLMAQLFEHGIGKTKKVKKVSGLDSIHWLFVGGPAHGETRWIKGNVSVTSMAVVEPLIPKGHSIPPGKHPMMMHKQIQYQGHDLVVDGYRYRIGAHTQEDFNAVPMDEFGKYIEEVGLTPYAQY